MSSPRAGGLRSALHEGGRLDTLAVVFDQPQVVALRTLSLVDPGPGDVLVQVDHSGISTGTERLLWSGTMPFFPGLGYPLVPGYEAVGRVVWAGPDSGREEDEVVFVAGSKGFLEARGLFGAQARTIVVPDLVIGHGALGRLVARILIASGAPAPTVWEINPTRRGGARGYTVLDPADDARKDYRSICDVSGANGILDTLIARMAPGGEIVLAGFYHEPVQFTFPPAFMKELRLRIAAEFKPADLAAVRALLTSGALDLSGLITHHHAADDADDAYSIAFGDPTCIKMVLDWRGTTS
ncbi:MAG: hypothetical protein MUF00_21000 [Gemmatimonadaceae bacterium]|nr:hypothetical protein [Gemmatimonadaceae bacterium]